VKKSIDPTPSQQGGHDSMVFDLERHYKYTLGRFESEPVPQYMLNALSLAVRDQLVEQWRTTYRVENQQQPKRIFYLSLEFLLGRTLSNAILNLNLQPGVTSALHACGMALEDLDAGLGNGGLGRLAACFLDSCATLGLPVMGYGIRYEYGMFHQRIEQGRQVEYPDHWLRDGNPWEIERSELTKRVKFYGHSEFYINERGRRCVRWCNTRDVLAVPYDVPIPGYGNGVVNTLRLWKSAATDEFDLNDFNQGDYAQAVSEKNQAEQITMVLYPNDASENGKELRLRQQYFLASASLQDVIETWVVRHGPNFTEFASKHSFQLNDTHPTLAVAELMRLLLDDYALEWDVAWQMTSSTMAYTNHTLLPEALERWPVRLMRSLIPRLLDIIFEINARFLAEVALHWPGDTLRQQRMSLIEESHDPHVRMAYLGIVGSFSVNGVAALHSDLLRSGLFKDFYELWPKKFNNKTNGVTPRRWLSHCNPGLSQLITSALNQPWVNNLDRLAQLKNFADDSSFAQQWYQIKQANKEKLKKLVLKECGVAFNPEFIFDVQVKRIHEYKRQLLNIMHVIHLYDRIKRGDTAGMKPRCVLIGGKAAPGYHMAKLIIKLINNVAQVVNGDHSVQNYLQLAFIPNYRVSSMEIICPGTDLSEQISTAGKEASGTGNMKFMMNGAITLGTYDGANIEILDAVGAHNFFLFGLKVEEIALHRHQHATRDIIEQDVDLKRVVSLIESGHFNLFEPGIFDPIVGAIRRDYDPWMVAADFRSYVEIQQKAAEAYQNQSSWTRMSILNTAASGRFSSDRTIREYARDIWQII
jgi:glycogen phosphorylase